MSQHEPAPTVCPGCVAPRSFEQARCWLSGNAEPPILATRRNASAATNSPAPQRGASTFGLATLFTLITVVAVCLGVSVKYPWLGIPVSIVIVPAYIRTFFSVRRDRGKGWTPNFADKAALFAASVFIIVCVEIAMGVAFVATCFPIGLATFDSSAGISIALGVGIVAAAIVAGAILWWTRKIG